MRKKLNSESGLTLVEMLCAVVILILLGLLLNTGLQMAMSTYRTIVARSEVELLLSTAVDALADDLRYARDVTGSGASFTYTSDSFGVGAALEVNSDGQIVAKVGEERKRLLSTGAYGLNGAYQVKKTADDTEIVNWNEAAGTFTIKLSVQTKDGKIGAETPAEGVTVRCLNPKKDETGG